MFMALCMLFHHKRFFLKKCSNFHSCAREIKSERSESIEKVSHNINNNGCRWLLLRKLIRIVVHIKSNEFSPSIICFAYACVCARILAAFSTFFIRSLLYFILFHYNQHFSCQFSRTKDGKPVSEKKLCSEDFISYAGINLFILASMFFQVYIILDCLCVSKYVHNGEYDMRMLRRMRNQFA